MSAVVAVAVFVVCALVLVLGAAYILFILVLDAWDGEVGAQIVLGALLVAALVGGLIWSTPAVFA